MRQSLSYHRLRDRTVAQRIVAATGLAPPAHVYEFGAGDGQLTLALAAAAGHVTAIEVDRDLHERLVARTRRLPNVRTIHADFRDIRLPATGDYHVVANLPFSLTAETLRLLTCLANPPVSAFLVVQREAAATWTGSGRATQASILAKLRFEFEAALALRRRDFSPWPRVDSVLLAMRRRPAPVLSGDDARSFTAFVRSGFGSGRPTLEANLRHWGTRRTVSRALTEFGLTGGVAPSSLSFEGWLALWRALRGGRQNAASRPGSPRDDGFG